MTRILIVLGFYLVECVYLSVGGFWYGRLLDARYGLSRHIEAYLAPATPLWVDAENYARQVAAQRGAWQKENP